MEAEVNSEMAYFSLLPERQPRSQGLSSSRPGQEEERPWERGCLNV